MLSLKTLWARVLNWIPSPSAIWLALAVIASGLLATLRRDAVARRDYKALKKDVEAADEIRRRVDVARTDHDRGVRPYKDAGWRD